MFSIADDRIALIDGDTARQVTYRELHQSPFTSLRSLIFLFNQNSIEDVLHYVNALNSGHVVCLLDARMPDTFKQKLIDLYTPHYLNIPWEHYREIAPGMHQRTRESTLTLHPDLALLLATSGTTGNPKLIRLSKTNIRSNARSIIEYLEITPQEKPIACLPFHYSYGLSVLNSHLMAGATVVLTKSSVAQETFWNVLKTNACTSLAGVPYTYALLDKIGFLQMDLPSLRTLTQAGGRLDPALIVKFHRKIPRFFVMYGQTEATARIAYLPPKFLPEKMDAIGIPIPGGALSVSHDGELIYRGLNVMMGYANHPSDLAKDDELHGVLHTEDLGYVDADRLYHVTGRSKRISKIYGLRISLDDIEKELALYGIAAAMATDAFITIYLEKGSHEACTYCVEHLSQLYQLHPTAFKCIPIRQLPRTSSGKIDYKSLP